MAKVWRGGETYHSADLRKLACPGLDGLASYSARTDGPAKFQSATGG